MENIWGWSIILSHSIRFPQRTSIFFFVRKIFSCFFGCCCCFHEMVKINFKWLVFILSMMNVYHDSILITGWHQMNFILIEKIYVRLKNYARQIYEWTTAEYLMQIMWFWIDCSSHFSRFKIENFRIEANHIDQSCDCIICFYWIW